MARMQCIAKNCEHCRLYVKWDMENSEGLRKQVDKCVFLMLAEEIPRLRAGVDGAQAAANEARNRAMETKETVTDNTVKFVHTLQYIASNLKMVEGG